MERDISALVQQMTLEEKASLCSGLDFWHTKPIQRLGIPSIMVSDGPHGLRKQREGTAGMHESVPATCFPSGAGLACSWDRDLIEQVGIALGEECQAEGVSVLLGPAANIKRSPLCGRNFEYFSEDPYLSSEMASSHIQGVQSQGVGTSLKHFAANNQEHRRMSTNAVISERVLREIYLASFEGAVKRSQPWTVMCAYNQVNGDFCSENPHLLTEVLKEEWGHEGFVMSDWGAVNERPKGLEAGLELEMPGNGGVGDRTIVEAVQTGALSEAVLDQAVERLLKVVFKAADAQKVGATYDVDSHHALARKAARECMVLLKNEDCILPIRKGSRMAVIGAFAESPRFQGGGSSHIQPSQSDDIVDEMRKLATTSTITYAPGYSLANDETDEGLLNEARQVAAGAEVAVVFAGLPERHESEGFDRTHLRIPANHQALIEAVSQVQPNVVVVLQNGSPVEMPWLSRVKGVLEAYLGGQACGGAVADVLFGVVSPSGRLAETFPKQLSHNPSYLNFPGDGDVVEYNEGLFVGYRYYDKKGIEPLFAFGYGLSYTTFEYSDLALSRHQIHDEETIQVRVTVKNTGSVPGREVVQLYVSDDEADVIRPLKELKGFAKVKLEPGEQKTVTFTLGKRAFAYYHEGLADWVVESGSFTIAIAKSAAEVVLTDTVQVTSKVRLPKEYTRNTTLGDLMRDEAVAPIIQRLMDSFQETTGMMDMMKDNPEMAMAMFRYMPLRGLMNFGQGQITETVLDALIDELNQTQVQS